MAAAAGQKTIKERLEAFPRGLEISCFNPENAIKAMTSFTKFDIDGIELRRCSSFGQDIPLEEIDKKVKKVFDEFVEKVEACKKPGTKHFDRAMIGTCNFANQVKECIELLRAVTIVHSSSSDKNSSTLDERIKKLREKIKYLKPIK